MLSIRSPQYWNVLPFVQHDVSLYHINDEYSFARVQQPISEEERALMSGVDEVFIHSPAVMARKGALCSSATLTPNGVDFEAFAIPQPMPADLAAIPGPRIGYSGFLKTQLDWELLFGIAKQNPQWSFVFVGKALDQPGLSEMLARIDALPNVHFLGAKSSRELASYPQHFDVCMLPYCVDDYTKYIRSAQAERVSREWPPGCGHADPAAAGGVSILVVMAATPEEWRQAISAQLLPAANTAEARAKRQSWAKARTWDSLVDTILDCVEMHSGLVPASAVNVGRAASASVGPAMPTATLEAR